MSDPTLKNIQDRMVPNLAKKSRDRNNQWLEPASYDKKMYNTIDQSIDLDQEEINDKFDNFSVQNAIKKNTKAPLREEEWIEALSDLTEDELNEIINEDEALEIFIEQTLRTSIKRGTGYGAAAGAAVGGIGGLGVGRFAGGAIGSKVGDASRGADVGGVAGGAAGAGTGAAVGAVAGGVAGAAAHGVRKLASKVRNRKINEAEVTEVGLPTPTGGQDKVNDLYEDEALDLLEEIMDVLEDEDNELSSHCWTDTVSYLKQARDCLVRNIVSEEVELTEEHFKAGSIKLKDKAFVKISKKDAKVLNAAVSGTDNKSKLIGTATKSKRDFDEFLDFARNLDENFSDTIDDLLNEATVDELDYIIENDLNEGESWEIIKNSTRLGVNVGKVAGAVGGGVYGATGGSILALTKAIVKRQKRKASVNKMFAEDEKKSVLGTAAPAMDSDELEKDENLQEVSKPKLERYLNKAIEDHGHSNFARNSTKDSGKESENRYWTRRTNNRKKGISRAIDKLEEEPLQEVSKELLSRYIKKSARSIVGDTAVSTAISMSPNTSKTDNDIRHSAVQRIARRYRGIDKAAERLSKKEKINEESETDLQESGTAYYYLINKAGASVTAHTSQPFFHSYEEAKEYQKKYKHVSSIKSSEIVKGKSDRYGFIRVIAETDLQESGGLGGHPANYRNPAEGPIKFRSVEAPVKPGKVFVITNNKKNIDGKLATKVGDAVNVKFSNVWFSRMEVIEMLPNNEIKVRAYRR